MFPLELQQGLSLMLLTGLGSLPGLQYHLPFLPPDITGQVGALLIPLPDKALRCISTFAERIKKKKPMLQSILEMKNNISEMWIIFSQPSVGKHTS